MRTCSVGKDLKLGVEAISTVLEAFGTPATSFLHFETRLSRPLEERGFVGIDELIPEEGEYYPTHTSYEADAVNPSQPRGDHQLLHHYRLP